MPMKRTERPGLCSPGRPGWKRPTTPWRFSPARSSRILVLPSVDGTLSEGISGRPRQVRNCEPNRRTVGGGTPRRVHSRPKAAIASGCARKKAGSFQTLVISSSRSSGVGAPVRVLMRCCVATLAEQAVVRVVDQLALLPLLDRLDRQAQLLLDLVVRAAVEVGDAGVHVEHRVDRAEEVFARLLLVVDEGLRQLALVAAGAGDRRRRRGP